MKIDGNGNISLFRGHSTRFYLNTHNFYIHVFCDCSVVVKLRMWKKIRTNLSRVRPPAEKGEKTGWNLAVIISPKVFL